MTVVHGRPVGERREVAQPSPAPAQSPARDRMRADQVLAGDQDRRLRQAVEHQAQLFAAWKRSRKCAEGGNREAVQPAKKPSMAVARDARLRSVVVEHRPLGKRIPRGNKP
ncbi:hypothetical protein [Siccirubricoccus phaeus]|uniref:hypothetical protein n=1 Tax=Siccirubricoccus phaeus TaxID=2595053 RepID=UPI0011F19338|nr:hypothetical protein [Siccirubricoccus phaeus]